MSKRISIVDGMDGSKLQMELDDETTVDEIISATSDHWKKESGAYVLKWGNALLRGNMQIGGVDVGDEDVLELIPDPEGG